MSDIPLNITSLYLYCPYSSPVLLWYWICNETQTNESERNNSIFNENLHMWLRSHVIKWEWFYGKEICHCIILSKSGRYNQRALICKVPFWFARFPFGGPLLQHTHLLQTFMKRIHNNLMDKWRPQASIEIESLIQFSTYSFINSFLNLLHEKSTII